MQLALLIPLFLSIYFIKKRSIADAAIYVYLSVFLLIVDYYRFGIPHLPSFSFADCALMPIVFTLLSRHWREWKFQRADLWLALFMFGAAYSEVLHSNVSLAGLVFCETFLSGVMPYILGKMLLENDGVRERFARRFVYLVLIVAIGSAWEYRMGNNLFTRLESIPFGARVFVAQLRGGHIRVSGTFTGPIQAGTMFAAAWLLSMWLGYMDRSRGQDRKYLGIRRSTLVSAGLLFGLAIANSRGPMVGAVLSFVIMRIGKAKNIARTAIITGLLIVVVGTAGYIKAVQYTAGSTYDAKDQEQEDAIYRRVLLDEYKPYVAAGGLFGYGVIARPVVPGMFSIDNAFLNIQLIQGNLGMWTFILMGAEGVFGAFLAARRATQRSDIYFALCIGGAMAGFLLSETTVWLGPPMYQWFFLLLGWSQSLRQTQTVGVMAPQAVPARFAFRRVIA